MTIIEKLHMFGHIIGLLISVGLLAFAWENRRHALGLSVAGMLSPLIVWLGSSVLSWLSDDPNVSWFWIKIGYLGVFTLPVAWFIFAMIFSGFEGWVNRRRVGLLLVIPLFLFGLVLTGAFFNAVQDILEGGRQVRQVLYSNWILVSLTYFYLLFGTGSFLMVRTAMRGTSLARTQVVSFVLASIIPVLANLVYLTQLIPSSIDYTSLTLVISAVLLVWGSMRLRLFDPIPIARGAVLDQISDGIIVINNQRRVADLNRAAQRFLGTSLARSWGQPFDSLMPQLAALPASTEITLEQNQATLYLEVQTTPLFAPPNYLVGHLILLHDISIRKQTEADLQATLAHERELNELKARFFADVTHELRTPLSVILSSSEMLESYGAGMPPAKQQVHYNRIRAAIDRLLYMSSQALLFEKYNRRGSRLELEWFDPGRLCQEVIDELGQADSHSHPIRFERPADSPTIHQDALRLRRALENLLSNAFKFSPAGTEVQVSLSFHPQEVHLAVTDHGSGIPAGDLPRLRRPFFRGSNAAAVPGTGLGLAIVDQIVEQIGGDLRLESQEKSGTTALLRIPRQLEAEPGREPAVKTR